MVAYDLSVNVVFFGGREFDSPPPLGSTERTRYVKVTTLDEAQGAEMLTWVEQAGRVPVGNEDPVGDDASSGMFRLRPATRTPRRRIDDNQVALVGNITEVDCG
jgi:hypothetical protein